MAFGLPPKEGEDSGFPLAFVWLNNSREVGTRGRESCGKSHHEHVTLICNNTMTEDLLTIFLEFFGTQK